MVSYSRSSAPAGAFEHMLLGCICPSTTCYPDSFQMYPIFKNIQFTLENKSLTGLAHVYFFFFVLPRGYSSDSRFVPDSTDFTFFAELLSCAIRAAQCSVLWNAGLSLSWSLKGSPHVLSDPKDFSILFHGCFPL